MADITMCTNNVCDYKEHCYKYQAKPNPYWQSYAYFDRMMDAGKCYEPITQRKKELPE